jgi:anti-sigma-K factor RskA
MDLHDLTAAYALDALDGDQTEEYERHLSECEECRAQLAELNETAAALPFATVAPEPPARLRAAILATATAERSNVVPLLQRRWMSRGLAIAAAAAACLVVALSIALTRSGGTKEFALVVDNGKATLRVHGLKSAASGKTYEAWVIPKNGAPRPAGLFSGGTTMVHLRGTVPPHATVAVTVERAGGVGAPTTTPIFSTPT